MLRSLLLIILFVITNADVPRSVRRGIASVSASSAAAACCRQGASWSAPTRGCHARARQAAGSAERRRAAAAARGGACAYRCHESSIHHTPSWRRCAGRRVAAPTARARYAESRARAAAASGADAHAQWCAPTPHPNCQRRPSGMQHRSGCFPMLYAHYSLSCQHRARLQQKGCQPRRPLPPHCRHRPRPQLHQSQSRNQSLKRRLSRKTTTSQSCCRTRSRRR